MTRMQQWMRGTATAALMAVLVACSSTDKPKPTSFEPLATPRLAAKLAWQRDVSKPLAGSTVAVAAGRLWVASANGKVTVLDAATGQELRTIPLAVAPGAVHDFDFSPDGSKLLLGHEKSTRDFSTGIHTDASLRVFDVQTGRQLKFFDLKQTFRKSGCNIGLPFVISADSTQMISITENCRLGIFDMSSWELKQEFHDPFQDANIDLALSPDNRLLAVAYQNKLELWDVVSAKLIETYSNPALKIYPRHRDAELGYIYQVAFSPDGSLLGTRFSGEYGMTYNSVITLWGVP